MNNNRLFLWILAIIGISLMFRYPILLVLVGFVIYLLSKNKAINLNELKNKARNAVKNGKVIDYNTINFNPKPMKKVPLKVWILLVAAIIIIFIIVDGFVSVPAGHVAVIYDRGRGVLDNELPEGLHLKVPLWQVATIMDTRLHSYTMSIAETEGSYYGDDSIESLTKDGQKVYVDVTIQYKILPDDASWIYQNIGSDEIYLEKIIRPGARNVIRDVVTGFDSTNLFTQETRLDAQEMMRSKLEELYGRNQISLEDVLLRNIKFSEVYLQAIEDKQVAQQRIQKADYEKQEAEKLKEKKIIEAQAEAEAIRLKGETLKANPQVIQFQFVDKMAPNITWGILPSDAIPFLDLKSMTQ